MKHLFIHIPFLIVNILNLFFIISFIVLYWIIMPSYYIFYIVWYFKTCKTNVFSLFKEGFSSITEKQSLLSVKDLKNFFN